MCVTAICTFPRHELLILKTCCGCCLFDITQRMLDNAINFTAFDDLGLGQTGGQPHGKVHEWFG